MQQQYLGLLITLPLHAQRQHGSKPLVVDNIAPRQLQQQHEEETLAVDQLLQGSSSGSIAGSLWMLITLLLQLQQQYGSKSLAVLQIAAATAA